MTPPSDDKSIRDRLRDPQGSDESTGGGGTRGSEISGSDFQNTHSGSQLAANGRDGEQRSHSAGTVAADVMEVRDEDMVAALEKSAERKVAFCFILSFLSVLAFVLVYFLWPFEFTIEPDASRAFQWYTPLLGITMALALGGIGVGAVLWAKLLMSTEEAVQDRHHMYSDPEDAAATAEALQVGFEETGLQRRPLLRRTLLLGAGSLPLLAVPFLFGLGPYAHKERKLATTSWGRGIRLVRENGTPVRRGDLSLGAIESVFPDVPGATTPHIAADSATILIRMNPDAIKEPTNREWTLDGHVAYSLVCTHAGCPVKLYEQQTHHLLCPCHQSTFAADKGAQVVFGPASRPLPQLAISVDDEGYFIATGDYSQPVGPSYWERKP